MQTTQNDTQSSFFRFPRLSEYATPRFTRRLAYSRIIRELKNIGASPGEIIGLMKANPDPPGNNEPDSVAIELDIGIDIPEPPAPPAPPVPCAPEKKMFTAQTIARALGIYSIYGLPHAHAVSAILNDNIFIEDEHKVERVLFKTREFTVYYTLYDAYAAVCVRNWLENRGYPYEVDGCYYTYHLSYRKD